MIKFQLYPFYKGSIQRVIMKTNPNGKGYITANVTFNPDTVYTATDPVVIKFIKGEAGDIREKSLFRPELVEELNHYKIPFEKIMCKTCTGSRPSVKYNPFQILEETNE